MADIFSLFQSSDLSHQQQYCPYCCTSHRQRALQSANEQILAVQCTPGSTGQAVWLFSPAARNLQTWWVLYRQEILQYSRLSHMPRIMN